MDTPQEGKDKQYRMGLQVLGILVVSVILYFPIKSILSSLFLDESTLYSVALTDKENDEIEQRNKTLMAYWGTWQPWQEYPSDYEIVRTFSCIISVAIFLVTTGYLYNKYNKRKNKHGYSSQFKVKIKVPDDPQKLYIIAKELCNDLSLSFTQGKEVLIKGTILNFKDKNEAVRIIEKFKSLGCETELKENEEQVNERK